MLRSGHYLIPPSSGRKPEILLPIRILELKDKHVLTVNTFPPVVDGHKDPFDRLLLAQAKTENFSFLTNDSRIPLYQERCVISQ